MEQVARASTSIAQQGRQIGWQGQCTLQAAWSAAHPCLTRTSTEAAPSARMAWEGPPATLARCSVALLLSHIHTPPTHCAMLLPPLTVACALPLRSRPGPLHSRSEQLCSVRRALSIASVASSAHSLMEHLQSRHRQWATTC